MTGQPEITLDDILAELTPFGRGMVEQAIGSAQRVKALRAEVARLSNQRSDAALPAVGVGQRPDDPGNAGSDPGHEPGSERQPTA